ncbi:hypothetical protein GMSM_07480 [Geomonas sp. Red276]
MAQNPSPGTRFVLMFVEDEVDSRDMLGRMLTLNYPEMELVVADHGAAGLEKFRESSPEIVLTDVNMPVMNGIEMARQIKQLSPDTTIVAVTAHSDTSYLLDAIEIGIDHYLLKPVNYDELFALLGKIREKIVLRRLVNEQLERIRRRDQQLSEAQKVAHLGSWEWDRESGKVTASDELYRIFGLEPGGVEPTYQALLERVPAAERPGVENAVRKAFERRDAAISQYFRIQRPDNSFRILRGQLEIAFDGEGGARSMIGTCHDLTEQRWAEAALQASERRFAKIFQATPELLSIIDLDEGRFVEVNDGFLKALGYRREEVIGQREQDLGVWGDQGERESLLRAIAASGEVRDLEARFRCRDGKTLAGLVSADTIEIKGRSSLLTLFNDITERKKLEEDRAWLAAIVESSDDAILAADPSGAIVSWNTGAEKMLGVLAEEAKGRHLSTLVPASRRDEMVRILNGVVAGEAVSHLETLYLTRDGAEIYVSLTLSPISTPRGELAGISCIARDVTERTRMEETIRHQAQHDTLTDLPNRKLFMDFLSLELAQARRNRKNLAVLFLDLDHFKQINDTLGHAAGDLLLQSVAQRLRRCVRESDTVARIGGDEFNVLMPDLTQTDDVGTVVGKIMGVFSTPFLLDNVEINATTSVGISMFPVDGESSEELVAKADRAMYVAKKGNGNSYQFYNEEINARTGRRQRMERLLREAVAKGELELVFQPQIRLDTGKVVSAEALLRWHHPELGLMDASQFIPIAEETGVIIPIGEWVIHQACAQMSRWRRRGYPFSLTVNLSNREFHRPGLVDLTSRALSESGLDPRHLELDITERAIMENPNFSLRTMRQLAGLGVTFSVDCFGTGASSLQRIKELPISKVKIDKSFIKNILTQPNDLAVVNAVICMSHNLSMRVNAVGVESQAQLEVVRGFGCDEVQGTLTGRPMAVEEFERVVGSG